MEKEYKQILMTFVLSLGITLITGLIPNNAGLIGVGYWGFPLPWMNQAVVLNPVINFDFSAMIIDLLAWWLIVYVLFFLALRFKVFERIGIQI